jgi:hypothetical protein
MPRPISAGREVRTKKKPDHRYAPMSGLFYSECNYLGEHSERTRTPVIRRATTRHATIMAADVVAFENAYHAADFTGRAEARQVHVICGRQDLSAESKRCFFQHQT